MEYTKDITKRTPELLLKKPITQTELITSCLSCLVEEVGETSAEIRKLTRLSFSQKKCDAFEMVNLEDEIVDVLITTLLLAESVGINSLDDAIERKIQKNNDRGY